MFPDFEKYNPLRSPAWRFDRVAYMLSHRPTPLRPVHDRDDDDVKAYREFLVEFGNRQTREDELDLFPENPGLFIAHMLHHNSDREWRAILQAYILTGLSDGEIAERISTIESAVRWYASLFFDVRDRLRSKAYVVKVIIGRPEDRQGNREGTLTAPQRDMLYKLYAFYGGPLAFETLLAGMEEHGWPSRAADMPGWLDRTFKSVTRGKSTAIARAFIHTRWTILGLFQIHMQILQLEQQAAMGGAGMTDITRNISEMLNEIPWVVGRRGKKTMTKLELKYSRTSVEPRADEYFDLARNQESEELQGLSNLRMRLTSEHTAAGTQTAPVPS